MNVSIIIPTTSPQHQQRVLDYASRQIVEGITFEIVLIQESNATLAFRVPKFFCPIRILKQPLHNDWGAKAKDRGILCAHGDYVLFWDDDNIYYQHALASSFAAAENNDLAIMRIHHLACEKVIPSQRSISPGDIDTMCLCVRRTIALTEQWDDGGGRYSDYRWVSRIAPKCATINYSQIIIGKHL